MDHPYLSIVVAVCNDEYNLPPFMERLYPVLQGMAKPFEIIFSNDGSRDRSKHILRHMAQEYPGVKVIELNASFGRQMANLAAFRKTAGRIVITLAADLTEPPEEIPRLVAEVERGRDLVGVVRQKRRETFFRQMVSRIVTLTANRLTGMPMSDPGCTLRAYHRDIIDNINCCRETTTSIPALAFSFCSNPAEIRGLHSERVAGEGGPPLSSLVRFNFDLITACSVAPLRLFTRIGTATTLFSAALILFLLIWRFLVGAELEMALILFAVLLFFIGINVLGIGIIGEYVGKIYQEVRRRPRFVVRNSYGFGDDQVRVGETTADGD